MPEEVDECVQSILEDNPGMDESTAHAICKDMDNRGVLSTWLEAEPDESNTAALAEFRNPGEIRRVEEGSGVRYKRVMLLSPGMWTDAGSEQTVNYSADGIRASADNFIDMDVVREEVPDWPDLSNTDRARHLRELGDEVLADEAPINFLHGPSLYGAESLDGVGRIPTDSIIIDDQGQMFGDLVIDGDTPQSETTIDLMDEVLEAAQEPNERPPPVGPSVEIPADDVEMDDRGVAVLQEAWYSGFGVVFNPASRPVELGAQAAERAVAMQAADDAEAGSVVYRTAGGAETPDDGCGDSLIRRLRHRRRMPDPDDPNFDDMNDEELARTLEAMREDMAELERALQGESEMAEVFDLTVQYQQEGNDLQDPVSDFADFATQNSDLDSDDLQDVFDAYLQAVDADSLDATPVEALQGWLEEMGAAGDGGEGGEGGDGEDNGEEMSMEDLEQVKSVVGEVSEHLGDIKDMLTAAHEEREEQLEDLERRLAEIEDEPQPRSLADGKQDDFYSSENSDDGEATNHEDVLLT